MKIDVSKILTNLAKERPVFHSEADFRLGLIFQLRETYPELHAISEYPFQRNSREAHDIVLLQGRKEVMAFELKYPCQKLDYKNGNEIFKLKWAGAADAGRHATLKDIERMEEFLETSPTAQAAVITLTNDPALWNGPTKTNLFSAAFDTQEGKIVTGTLKWAPKTSDNTKRRYSKVKLFGIYKMKWENYSQVDGKFGQFRYLHIPVQPPKTLSG